MSGVLVFIGLCLSGTGFALDYSGNRQQREAKALESKETSSLSEIRKELNDTSKGKSVVYAKIKGTTTLDGYKPFKLPRSGKESSIILTENYKHIEYQDGKNNTRYRFDLIDALKQGDTAIIKCIKSNEIVTAKIEDSSYLAEVLNQYESLPEPALNLSGSVGLAIGSVMLGLDIGPTTKGYKHVERMLPIGRSIILLGDFKKSDSGNISYQTLKPVNPGSTKDSKVSVVAFGDEDEIIENGMNSGQSFKSWGLGFGVIGLAVLGLGVVGLISPSSNYERKR